MHMYVFICVYLCVFVFVYLGYVTFSINKDEGVCALTIDAFEFEHGYNPIVGDDINLCVILFVTFFVLSIHFFTP